MVKRAGRADPSLQKLIRAGVKGEHPARKAEPEPQESQPPPPERRVNVSMKKSTADHLRRLAAALFHRDGRLPALDQVVAEAAGLLEADLKRKRINIPDEAPVLKSGPRG